MNRYINKNRLHRIKPVTMFFCYSFVCMTLLAIPSVQAQSSVFRDIWYRGTLILAEGDTLSGEIHYELETDLVQISTNNTVKTYSARQIWSFQIYDPDMMLDRHFYSLPFTVEASYKVPVLFELLTEGDLSLLTREKLVTENIPQYNSWSNNSYSYTRTRLGNDFYFGYENGKIKKYEGSKRDFFYLIKDKSNEIKKFVNENRLRYNDKYDLIQIINYYNSIKTYPK